MSPSRDKFHLALLTLSQLGKTQQSCRKPAAASHSSPKRSKQKRYRATWRSGLSTLRASLCRPPAWMRINCSQACHRRRSKPCGRSLDRWDEVTCLGAGVFVGLCLLAILASRILSLVVQEGMTGLEVLVCSFEHSGMARVGNGRRVCLIIRSRTDSLHMQSLSTFTSLAELCMRIASTMFALESYRLSRYTFRRSTTNVCHRGCIHVLLAPERVTGQWC